MPIAKFDALQKLIKSLSKAEKRHFILYANRLTSNKEVLFLKMFSIIDGSITKDESTVYRKLNPKSKDQFTNAKRHLYSQILKSLRLQRADADKLRKRIDYALILYEKGMYYESLSILDNIAISKPEHDNIHVLEVIELQKKIESRHITRSRLKNNKLDNLVKLSKTYSDLLSIETTMTNLSIEAQGAYIKWGFAKDEKDAMIYRAYFKNQIPSYEYVKWTPTAVVLWHQSHVWYNYMRLDFHFCYKNAVQWVQTMQSTPKMIDNDPDIYARGFHYILTSCYYLNRPDKYVYWFKLYKVFRDAKYASFNVISRQLDFCYYDNALLNNIIMTNDYSNISTLVNEIEVHIEEFRGQIDIARIMIFYYKIAITYSYTGEVGKAIDYLTKIIDNPDVQLRSEIICYARLINLMCHYQLNNFNLVLNLLSSIRLSFESNNQLNPVVDLMIGFLRKGSRAMNFGIDELISTTFDKISKYQQSRYDKVAFLYYDFTNWLLSISKGVSVEKIKRI